MSSCYICGENTEKMEIEFFYNDILFKGIKKKIFVQNVQERNS